MFSNKFDRLEAVTNIRVHLRKFFFLSVRPAQLTGSFTFFLNKEGYLEFAWSSWQFVLNCLSVICFATTIIVYLTFHDEYSTAFGQWTRTDRVATIVLILAGFFNDWFQFLTSMVNRSAIVTFHETATNNRACLIIENCTEFAKEDCDRERYIKTWLCYFKKRGKSIRFLVKLTSLFVGFMYIEMLWGSVIGSIYIYHLNFWLIVTLPIIVLFMAAFSLCRSFHLIALAGSLSYIWFGYRGLREQCQHVLYLNNESQGSSHLKPSRVKEAVIKLLKDFKTWNETIDQFNAAFGFHLLVGILNSMVSILTFFFQASSWMAELGIFMALSLSPALLVNITGIFCLYATVSRIDKTVKQCYVVLRDVGACQEVVEDKHLFLRVKMYHFEGVFQCPRISGGNFFNIGSRSVPIIIATMITYLVVLVQFQVGEGDARNANVRLLQKTLNNVSIGAFPHFMRWAINFD